MMWVYDTLPPRARRRWLLITTRWSISSLTGSDRTLVAVGTDSEMSMFFAVRAGAPFRVVRASLISGGRSTVGVRREGVSERCAAGAAFAGGSAWPRAGAGAGAAVDL